MFKLKNIKFSYKNHNVFNNINFNVEEWEFISIIWNSWAWKSTLLKLLTNELRVTSWEIFNKNNKNINNIHFSERRKFIQDIWVIFQDYKLLEKKTVYENIAFAMYVTWRTNKELKEKAPQLLKKVWLFDKKDKLVSDISWWESQRVAIARSLVNNPSVIIADEPTWNLDPSQSLSIIEILKQLNEEWVTILLSTHNNTIVNSLKKRVITLKDWKIFSDVTPWTYNI